MHSYKQYVRAIIQQYVRRYRNPTKGDTYLQIVFWILLVGCMLLSLIFLATGDLLFASLMDAALAMIAMLIVIGYCWRLRDIVAHIKAHGVEDRAVTLPPTLLASSDLSGREQIRKVGRVLVWQYVFALLCLFLDISLISGKSLPAHVLALGLACLMVLLLLWVVARIWSYRPSSPRENPSQVKTVKLAFTLVSAGFALMGVYLIMSEILVLVSMTSILPPSLVVVPLLPLVCGSVAGISGLMLMIHVRRSNGTNPPDTREQSS